MDLDVQLGTELLLLGATTGFLGGLLSMGGGLILVPGLLWLLSGRVATDTGSLMALVLGTSMAAIVVTAWSSRAVQRRAGNVSDHAVHKLQFSTAGGVAVGALLATLVHVMVVKAAFGLFCVYCGLRMAFGQAANGKPGASLDTAHTGLHGLGMGALCGLLSLGGAYVVVPYLLRHQIDFKKAAGTATALQVPIGMAGALAYIVLGLRQQPSLPPGSIGYLYLPALLAIAATSTPFARLGASLQQRVAAAPLKRTFGLFTAFIGLQMLALVVPQPFRDLLLWAGAVALTGAAARAYRPLSALRSRR
jgi:uncharacterized membrane protein YfcA